MVVRAKRNLLQPIIDPVTVIDPRSGERKIGYLVVPYPAGLLGRANLFHKVEKTIIRKKEKRRLAARNFLETILKSPGRLNLNEIMKVLGRYENSFTHEEVVAIKKIAVKASSKFELVEGVKKKFQINTSFVLKEGRNGNRSIYRDTPPGFDEDSMNFKGIDVLKKLIRSICFAFPFPELVDVYLEDDQEKDLERNLFMSNLLWFRDENEIALDIANLILREVVPEKFGKEYQYRGDTSERRGIHDKAKNLRKEVRRICKKIFAFYVDEKSLSSVDRDFDVRKYVAVLSSEQRKSIQASSNG